MRGMVKIYFSLLKISGEILNKLRSKGFLASSLSTYDFSTLYNTLPHHLIKEKLTELIEQTLTKSAHFVMRKAHFSLLNNLKYITFGHVRKFVMLSIILCTIYL